MSEGVGLFGGTRNLLIKAKCPECGGKAGYHVEEERVRCDSCRFSASYEDYVEMMKDRLTTLTLEYSDRFDVESQPRKGKGTKGSTLP